MSYKQAGNEPAPGRRSPELQLLENFASFAGFRLGVAAAYTCFAAIMESAVLSLLVPLLGILFNGSVALGPAGKAASALFGLIGTNDPVSRLLVLVTAFAAVAVLRAVIVSARDVRTVKLQTDYIVNLRMCILNRLAGAEWSTVSRLRHARVTHLMSGDIQRLGAGIEFVLHMASASVMLFAQFALAIVLAPGLALALATALLFGAWFFRPVLRRARALGTHAAEANLSLLDGATQYLGGLKLAMGHGLQNAFVEQSDLLLRETARRHVAHAREHAQMQTASACIAIISGGVLFVAGYAWFHVSPAILMTILVIVMRMVAPATALQQLGQQISYAAGIYQKVRELECELDDGAIRNPPEKCSPGVPDGSIAFERVSFAHSRKSDPSDGAESGVQNLELTIAPGEFVAITGQSGCGKTTFADLLSGLLQPQAGRIMAGGVMLEKSVLASWRASLGYVCQDQFLFHNTLRMNLSWANPGATEEEMCTALDLADASGLIRRLPRGLDSVVGERGALLSGGERQRISIARVLLRRPRVLLLDEPTSALDTDAERRIFKRLRHLPFAPTIVLICHRGENLGICDRVLRFEPGGRLSPANLDEMHAA